MERTVRTLVEHFYGVARRDDLLGPVFDAHVADWDEHYATLTRFWMAVAYRTGGYSGRPYEQHAALPDLSVAHFDRWLVLWEAAVQEIVPADQVASFMTVAERMRGSWITRLGLAG